MSSTTLMLLHRKDSVLLAYKKRGFGAGKWNGVGGKLEPGETIEQALVRECNEEIGVTPTSYHKVAEFLFHAYHDDKPVEWFVHTYLCDRWEGEPTETEEMRPQWFSKDAIPFEQMWADDRYWLPQVLDGKKMTGVCTFNKDNTMISHKFELVEGFKS